jgi:hypothetical protein
MDWIAALEYVSCLNTNSYLGFSDWHLPNKSELSSLLNYEPSDYREWMASQGFRSVQPAYWSSTTRAGDSYSDQLRWVVSMASTYYMSSRSEEYVWPVRGSTSVLPRTGQTRMYAAGDDGFLQVGAAWPDPRFTSPEGSSGVLLDELTGLMWAQDANAPGPSACNPGVQVSWQDALAYVDCLNANNYLGHSDWLLPNINELESVLIPDGPFGPFYWLNGQGFRNVQAGRCYWSSTTVSSATNPFAWCIAMVDGARAVAEKNQTIAHFVWPVRRRQ